MQKDAKNVVLTLVEIELCVVGRGLFSSLTPKFISECALQTVLELHEIGTEELT